jgi:MFS family permease
MAETPFPSPSLAIHRRYVLLLLFCSYSLAFVDRGLVSVTGPLLEQDLALSDTQFGLLAGSAFVLLYSACGVPVGFLADRYDRRALIAAGLAIWSLMTALCGLSRSYGGFFCARMGVGLGESCLVPAGVSLIASITPRGHAGRSIAIFLMGATVGNGIAQLGGGEFLRRLPAILPWSTTLAGLAPWRRLFLLASLPGILLAALVLTVRDAPRLAAPQRPVAAFQEAFRIIGRHAGPYGYLTATTACILILAQTPAAWATLFYARSFGLAPASSATLVGVCLLSSAPLGQWLGGALIDELDARGFRSAPLIAQLVFALAALPAAMTLCLSRSLIHSVVAYGIFNLAIFAATPAGLTGWQMLSPERSRGLIVALGVSLVTLVSIGAGPPLVGVLSDQVFRGEGSLGRALLTVLVVAIALTVILGIPGVRSFARAELAPRLVRR